MYENQIFWHSKILPNAIIPDATLKPGDFEGRNQGGPGSYRPNMGFNNRNNNYQNNNNPAVANRFIQ